MRRPYVSFVLSLICAMSQPTAGTAEAGTSVSLGTQLPPGFLPKPTIPYDPTNGTMLAVDLPSPYTALFKALQDRNQTLFPRQVIFEVTEGPDHAGLTSSPRAWRHVIDDEHAIHSIVAALLNAKSRQPLCSWGPVVQCPLAYVYRLTLIYGPKDPRMAGQPVNSVTLDLSSAWSNVYDYRPLEQVLAPYPPGFEAQWVLHIDP